MNTLFGNQTTEGVEERQDRLGGFRVVDTDIYLGKIKLAYAGKSATSQAMSVTVVFDSPETGEYRETVWVTSGQGVNTYPDKQDPSKKHYLPGWVAIDDICLVTINKGLKEALTEEKVINLYNADTKQEEPTKVQMFTELLGKDVYLAIVKQTVNKQKKTDAGYVDTDETRDENAIEKVFHYPSKLSVVEAQKKIQQPAFFIAWKEKNAGKTRDRVNKDAAASGVRSGRPGQPPKAGESAPKTNSLF